ncbi:hypothetical protein [Rubrivirga marina]|uniref:Late embryogenesis abundant protein LEA-2 subgroup domain-containing protein n=1 Tax=Rubrivirga marina TaxID=1196024 RepID=A0A271J373_9BACT|nr:hypothetical protein [Rubrivirga marina]PAP77800.1 hypothetical protein BSZ37_15785 [Rubrivirga marina]
MPRLASLSVVVLGVLLTIPGCTTIQQLAALQNVDFELDRLSNGLVAGVDLDRLRGGGSLGPTDLARLGAAATRGEVPLSFVLHVGAENPSDNAVAAQLVSLDWTLFLDGNETISGVYNDDRQIPPGQTVDLPISMELDLVQFFGRNVGDLAQLVGNLAGANSQRQTIRLEAQPSISTQFGPLRYPGTISIEFPVGS